MNRLFKMLFATLMMLTLGLALTAPALAHWGTLYVSEDNVKAYATDDTSAKVVRTLKGGTKLEIDALSPDGKWAQLSLKTKKGRTLCFVQMKYLRKTFPRKYCKHQWSNWKVVKEATCAKEGKKERSCSVCGKEETTVIKKAAHTWGKWKVVKEATCTKQGEKTRKCKVCKKKQKQTIEKAAHKFGKWNVSRQASCTSQGEKTRKCSACGFEQKQAIAKLPHQYGEWTVLREASCAEAGLQTHVCSVCGHEEQKPIAPLPHDFETRIRVEATDHSAGTREKICRVCGLNAGEESFDPEGTLRRGDRSVEVYNVQQLLVDQNYLNVGGADGIFGGGTEMAVMKFQKDQGLNPDGVVWPQTLKRLNHTFAPWETIRKVTRTEPGERMRVCTDCGFEQHEVIEPGEVLERGRRGEDIRALQQIVKELGYDAGGYDGIYGGKLDAAVAGFAADNGLTVEEGKIRPADVDALVNAWLAAGDPEKWMGGSRVDSPVSLALSVTPMNDESVDAEATTFRWSLTNLGSEKCTFAALLLTFGDAPDFTANNLVMVLDGIELKPNADNSASGSFTVSMDWGEGDMNFAALGVSEGTGAKWLSNTVAYGEGTALPD